METVWHYSALRTGLGIAPAPLLAGVLSVSAGRIQHHFGQLAPALLGVLTMGLAGLLWRLDAGPSRHYVTEMLPSLLLSGASGGLTVAPLFAQTSTLASERATTGSALLNVSRQLGSAIGIAVVVAARGSGVGLSGFRFAWTAQFIVEIGHRDAARVASACKKAQTIQRPPTRGTGVPDSDPRIVIRRGDIVNDCCRDS